MSTHADALSLVMAVAEPRAARGGRLASRLIQDWYAGRLVQDEQDLPAGSGPEGRKAEPPTQCSSLREFPPRPDAGSDHDFVIIMSQSYDEAHDPEARGRSLVRCMCRYCRFHFSFHIYPPISKEATAHLQHHLRLEGAEWHGFAEPASVQPCEQHPPRQGRFRYVCTLCGMAIHLEMSSPLLKPEWIKLIMNEDKIREALRIAREQDPERYADISPGKETHYVTSAPSTLNQYLKNILEEDVMGPRKKISFRNKTFQVQFGPDCESMFQYLGFEVQYDPATEDSYWVPPRLPPQEGKTPVGSFRAFYEDVRSEVQSLLDDKPLVNGQPVVKVLPIPAREQLEKALGCEKAPRGASTVPASDDEAEHFAILGAPVGADDALLRYAYSTQVETDPEHTSAYLKALGSLSERRSEELQMFVIAEQESLATKKEASAVSPDAGAAERAYAHFRLRRDCAEAPGYFIRVYRTYREESPAQKSDHRLALLEIAKDRDSDEIAAEVYGTEMELAEACQFLNVQSDWPMDSIAQMAHSVASDTDIDLVLMALDTVSRNRPLDDPNRPAFEEVLTVLRASRQLHDISSNAGRAGEETAAPDGSRAAVDVELPVGLANLRNTCYLNSILQYFYSVNAVRELTLNADMPALEPTEENLSNLLRRSGNSSSGNSQSQSDLETGRTFVGYEFTRELSILFREIEAAEGSSISPRQRLANAALLRPEMLRPRSADSKAVPGANDGNAPPLPPRTTDNSKSKVPESPMTETELCETASSTSSRTLVNQLGTESPSKSVEENTPATADVPAADQHAEEQPKMSKLTVEELAVELDKPNVGSDQMDVDEVMGNAIDHLRAAFKVSGIGGSGSAPDPIEQAFFSTFIDNRKKIGERDWNRTSRSDRWVTAYPAKSGTLDLYDALANSFDLEPLPGNLLSFTTIKRPAPHFHVCIQRADGLRKNVNAITIPETLYLDRFMHTDDSWSPLARGRKRRWDIKARLNEMTNMAAEHLETAEPESRVTSGPSKPNAQYNDLPEEEIDAFLAAHGLNTPVQGPPFPATEMEKWEPDAGDSSVGLEMKQLFAKYGVAEPGTASSGAPRPPRKHDEGTAPPVSDLDGFWEKFVAEENAERDRLIAERDSIFSDSHAVAYRLHAVVCHAGSTASAGHYWVWIHDFERDVWCKYNDTTVSVHPAEFVFGELNTKGEPYYLAYVKADEVQNLVSIPQRRPQPNPPPVPPRIRPASSQDTAMPDADGVETKPIIEHVEDAEMHPLPTAAA
ncbi:hypothetical protein C8A03DRAFT_34480 [Achaetomium macrosporum]|uniref:ubiquitinyl hydrolase 1 n=1 Tax=Achaetomium macrosporum TaxID=79813 RepID=A0AAN7CAT9_9PEZI|nr:hypothetical protein C8A03DRAFT_34480 [Achaetomium macrosporum]